MRIPEKAWEKARRECDCVLSREVGMYKGPEVGGTGLARKQKSGTE